MANEDFKRMLNLSKQADDIAKGVAAVPQQQTARNGRVPQEQLITADNFDKRIAELDEKVFGKYEKPQNTYDAEEEMEKIKSRNSQNLNIRTDSKMPAAILEEMIRNPYNLDPNIVTDPKMSVLEDKLKEKNFSGEGIAKAQEIQKRLDEQEKAKVNEVQQKQQSMSIPQSIGVDYSIIKMIIENVIDERLSKLQGSILNESKANSNPKQASMIMLGDNFTFVDPSGNMYKCSDIKFVGKAKLKNKQ